MRKSLIGLWAIIIIFIGIIIPFYGLTAFTTLKTSETHIKNVNREKRSTNFKINEEDFINTMFLRSSFFENWSDTNYFVNPTLKTSKSLTYNENWYMDFLKDSYATGIVFDKPSDKFLELYKNWYNYVKQYKLDRFYNVDKKFFLKDLTNFMYTYFKKYDGSGKATKMQQSIKDLQQVKFNEDNWKLVDISWQKSMKQFENEFLKKNNKWYFFIESDTYGFNKFLAKNNGNNIKEANVWSWILKLNNGNYNYFDVSKLKSVYLWDENSEPKIPTINNNTGEITEWNEKIES